MRGVVLIILLSFGAVALHAQTPSSNIQPLPIQTEYVSVGSTLVQPDETTPARGDILPEAPIPKSPASPCPAGYGKPCAFLNGNLYARDRFHLREYDRSWTKALSNPAIITSTAVLTTALVVDYKTTRFCIDRHLAREANPLMGQSRKQELGVGLGLLTAGVLATAKLKSQGHGDTAILIQSMGTIAHLMAAYQNAVVCGYSW
jgi:hypothetical protein